MFRTLGNTFGNTDGNGFQSPDRRRCPQIEERLVDNSSPRLTIDSIFSVRKIYYLWFNHECVHP